VPRETKEIRVIPASPVPPVVRVTLARKETKGTKEIKVTKETKGIRGTQETTDPDAKFASVIANRLGNHSPKINRGRDYPVSTPLNFAQFARAES
jgi:hypothetical protein